MSEADGCGSCEGLRVEWAIRSPGELMRAVRIVGSRLDDGDLRIAPGFVGFAGVTDFAAIRKGGTTPDHIDLRFECTGCGGLFELAVETYHGAGGAWKPL